jgi:uncharacterized protein DUF6496
MTFFNDARLSWETLKIETSGVQRAGSTGTNGRTRGAQCVESEAVRACGDTNRLFSTSFAEETTVEAIMAKYGKSASKTVKSAMHRKKKGTLKSGSGRKVTSRKQAIAIGLSEARKKGAKVPSRKSSAKSRKTTRKTSSSTKKR